MFEPGVVMGEWLFGIEIIAARKLKDLAQHLSGHHANTGPECGLDE
jgi:hypothetical protein